MLSSNLQNNHNHSAENGNVLFLIFIAVILFGALSFAVSDMMRGASPERLQEEKASLFADSILGYGRILRTAIKDMRINGCAPLEISFENQVTANNENELLDVDYTHEPPADEKCKVFSPQGGGVNYSPPDPEWLSDIDGFDPNYGQWYFPADVCIPGIGTSPEEDCDGDGEDNEDIVLILPYISPAVCKLIQARMEVDEEGESEIPQEEGNAWTSERLPFIGAQEDGEALDQDYQQVGCFEGANATSFPPAGTYHFFQVLLAR
ncbi:MAG: hypothetical protein AAF182_01630 [Pseudomonadota bacterium]